MRHFKHIIGWLVTLASFAWRRTADGPLVVRTGVWLIVLVLALVCVLPIKLSLDHTSRPTRGTASEDLADPDSSIQPPASVRTVHKRFTAEAYESGSGYDSRDALLSMVEQMTQDRRTWMDNPE